MSTVNTRSKFRHKEAYKNVRDKLASKSLLKHGSSLGLFTLLSRILGLGREMTKAALLGTSALSDAFSVAFMIPNLFRRLFAEGSIAVAFIPTFKSYLIDGDEQKTKEFLNCFWTFLSFCVSVFCAAGILAAPFIINLFKLGGGELFSETVFLTRFMFPFLAFISVAAFFQGLLNSVNIFSPSGFAPVLLNIITIICAWFLKEKAGNPARAMALGILLGGFLEAAFQLPFVWKNKFKFFWISLKKAAANPGTRTVLKLIVPTIIGMAAYQVNDLVSTALARNAGEGIVSSLQFSLRLQELLLGIFAVSIGTVLLPDLSGHAKQNEWDAFNQKLSQALEIISLIMIPVTFFSLSQSETLIRLLFQMRNFDENSVALTVSAFNCHICGLYFIAQNRVLAPAFYTQKDSKSPAAAGIASFAVNIALAALFAGRWKGAGIAAALSISSAVNTALLFILLKNKKSSTMPNLTNGVLQIIKSNALYLLKIIFFSALSLIPSIFTQRALSNIFIERRNIIPFLASALIFALCGIILLLITRDRNALAVIKIKNKLWKK